MWFILVLIVIFISICAQSITNLDIFTLGYILSCSIGYDLCLYRPISSQCVHFIYHENARKTKAFQCFQGLWNGNNGQKWFNQICNTKMRTCLEHFNFISMLLHQTVRVGWGLRKRGLKVSWKLISKKEIVMKG